MGCHGNTVKKMVEVTIYKISSGKISYRNIYKTIIYSFIISLQSINWRTIRVLILGISLEMMGFGVITNYCMDWAALRLPSYSYPSLLGVDAMDNIRKYKLFLLSIQKGNKNSMQSNQCLISPLLCYFSFFVPFELLFI